MSDLFENPSTIAARTIVKGLVRSGVTWAAYCPGSRGAPFAYALAEAELAGHIQVATFIDERSAGFWAIGAAKSLSAPVAIFTTSGTAAVELHPAIQEAHHAHIPLVAVTADRPTELRQVGASQTTVQPGLFGRSVRAEVDIPAEYSWPESRLVQLENRVQRLVMSATGCSGGHNGPEGPVHLNVGFRDPLTPNSRWLLSESAVVEADDKISQVRQVREVFPSWDEAIDPDLRTVVIAGDRSDWEVCQAAAHRNIPIFAEPTSMVREFSTWIPYAPLLLPSMGKKIQQVIVTGHPTLSRPVTSLLAAKNIRKIVVAAQDPWVDLSGTATLVVPGLADSQSWPTSEFLVGNISEETSVWLKDLLTAANMVEEDLSTNIDDDLNLLSACRAIWSSTYKQATMDGRVPQLWLGASNTIRGFDVAAGKISSEMTNPMDLVQVDNLGDDLPVTVQVMSNRALAGIDGTIASAMGVAMASGKPVRAVMGDLTFCYDLSSLPANPAESQDKDPDLQIIVLDDGGGSIFASLEHGDSKYDYAYQRFFTVKQNIDPFQVASACGWKAYRVDSIQELKEHLEAPIVGKSLISIDIPAPTELLAELRKRIDGILVGTELGR